tara:strand:+ start:146 stop:463 length:318 start_codon:yes stop_codon:yes gene_type:complete
MGIFKEIKEIKDKMIINFLSNRANLTVFQCLLYFIIGYIMGQHLGWLQLLGMFIIILCIQFITRVKAVADGMVFHQLIEHRGMDANEIVKRIKEEADRIKKEDWN